MTLWRGDDRWTLLFIRSCCAAMPLAFGACGGGSSTSPAPVPSPPSSGAVTISGREPLGWSQAADSLAGYSFSIYVDGVKGDAQDATCIAGAGSTFECRASLPPMSNGLHTLEISATVSTNGERVEGPKSAPLTVTVNAAAADTGSVRIAERGAIFDGQQKRGNRTDGVAEVRFQEEFILKFPPLT